MSPKLIFDTKNVLVLGGAGFIGSHLCDSLVKDSKVICVDNLSSGSERNIDHLLSHPNFKFIKHDLSLPISLEDYTELNEFRLEFQGIQEIYNFACPTSPKDFMKNRLANALANSYVVKNSLDLCLKYKAKFLHASSSVVYGSRQSNLERLKESDIGTVDQLSERCSYDEGKRFAESLVKTYLDIFALDVKIARLFRVYGPRMPLNDGHMVPDFIDCALSNKNLTIYGNEHFSTSLCYVDDVVSGLIKIMEATSFGPYNLGSDVDLKLTDVAQKIIDIVGSDSTINYEQGIIFMTHLSLPDIAKARNTLSWMPLTTLENGLKKTIEDLEANKNLKNI